LLNDPGLAGLACPAEKEHAPQALRAKSREGVLADCLDLTVTALADDLRTTVALFLGQGRDVHAVADAARGVPLPPPTVVRELTKRAPATPANSPALVSIGGEAWTLVRLPGSRKAAMLAAHGDRMATAQKLSAAASTLSSLLVEREATRNARCQAATHALGRRLARVYGFSRMADIVASAAAGLLGARVASTAIFDPITQVLKVRGTFGYPSLLVEHARIIPGEGIIGSVFQSGAPLWVPDVRAHDDLFRSRPRYRTNSFIAVPVRAGQRILGVISATDRINGRPFTRQDVSSLRTLAAPVALALSRELAVSEAEQYAHAAAIDPLSGLFNRRYLHVRLEEELERARRHQIPLALLMIDLDDFKMVNDRFGHLAGDAVIREAAVILRRTVRMFDVCTRYGGEEFAILMPNSGAQSAATVAERIRRRIESYRFAEPALAALSVTASIGLAVSTAQLLPRDLIERADQALYQAKTLGKNRVWFG
jgi:diguanylate cyclase (GGDEF)-like protein